MIEVGPADHLSVRGQRLLVLSDVDRTFLGSPPVRAVRSANVSVYAGDYLSIMGRSGSGKSTLLNLMGLLDGLTSGSINFAGSDVGDMSDRQRSELRSKHIGFVFQTFQLLPHRSATENVALGLLYQRTSRQLRRPAALEALTRVGLRHRAEAFPKQLSGGEQQRVAIARAIAGRPDLLLCDEPTGNLDVPSGEVILDLLDSLNSDGITVIVVTHDPDAAIRTRRHLVMTDGFVREKASR